MKDKFIRHLLLLVLAVTAFSVLPLYAAPSSKTMYVSLDPAPVKESASSFSKDVGSVAYGDRVLVLEEKKNWMRIECVDDTSVTGWVPASALSTKKIKAKGTGTTADADEIALAGKGFTSTIEAVYAEEYDIDYSAVDFAEEQTASVDAILDFIREGGLAGGDE